MHLYLAFLFRRDYFGRSDASLSGSFVPQGLFRPAECISIWLFCSTEIISTARIHLYLAFLFHRDYFGRPDSSLSGSFAPQGLFRPPGFISIWLFCSTGIISAVWIHLYLALLFHKDYFNRPDSSLSGFSGIQLACKFYFPHSFRTNSRQSSRRRPIDLRPLTPPCVPFGTRRFNQFNK